MTGINDAPWRGPAESEPLNDHPGGYAIVVLKLGESEEVDLPVELRAGWNMVSVPVHLESGSDAPLHVFPGAVAVYTWNPGSKSYEVPDDILPDG